MKKQTIVVELELDCNSTSYHFEDTLRPNHIYIFDIPRIDLRQYACVRVKISTKQQKDGP